MSYLAYMQNTKERVTRFRGGCNTVIVMCTRSKGQQLMKKAVSVQEGHVCLCDCCTTDLSSLLPCRAIRKEMGLQGMLSARQLKKKWDNLKEKYRVSPAELLLQGREGAH